MSIDYKTFSQSIICHTDIYCARLLNASDGDLIGLDWTPFSKAYLCNVELDCQ